MFPAEFIQIPGLARYPGAQRWAFGSWLLPPTLKNYAKASCFASRFYVYLHSLSARVSLSLNRVSVLYYLNKALVNLGGKDALFPASSPGRMLYSGSRRVRQSSARPTRAQGQAGRSRLGANSTPRSKLPSLVCVNAALRFRNRALIIACRSILITGQLSPPSAITKSLCCAAKPGLEKPPSCRKSALRSVWVRRG